jgi:tRNA (mo5U34)-methyltransferase
VNSGPATYDAGMKLFDRESLYRRLSADGYSDWACELRRRTETALNKSQHGNLETWTAVWNQLPDARYVKVSAESDAVTICGELIDADQATLRQHLMAFHPWRKGPFKLFGLSIDTEWRSCLKWDRLAPHVDFRERRILDVGCGNGYYGWRMLQAGAGLVVGFDPFLLFLMQFETIRRYAEPDVPHYVLPLTDEAIPERLNAFDVTLSMGVLYHRTSPIDHLQSLAHSLRPGGTLVLETLIIESNELLNLVPRDRYAKMRNVWFIPSIPMLLLWLSRTGFRDPQILDISPTTTNEQRRTDWMTFESLSDFLDPTDSNRTIEGYPAPVRVMISARKA